MAAQAARDADFFRSVRDAIGGREAELEKKLAGVQKELEAEREKLEVEREKLAAEHEKLEEERESKRQLEERVVALETEMAEAMKKYKEEVSELNGKLEAEVEKGIELCEKIEALQASYTSAQDAMEMTQIQKMRFEEERDRLEAQLGVADAKVASLDAALADKTKKLEAVEEEMSSVGGSLNAVLKAFGRR